MLIKWSNLSEYVDDGNLRAAINQLFLLSQLIICDERIIMLVMLMLVMTEMMTT